ncbi:hypothetical protein FJ422_30825 [Mesorhizobium sp. B2-6-3]|uniref:hypothetical protein n=1 Tax=Mesorhizobium sp. B2-6-3 TaxID=2589914 RepID=UPI001126EE79|nr:hypothetical protein [Mesorhizobium sp. B2-6-3]TPJ75814.1 hypothetical protein FJ422_30825 [Mesorhizobium sp. B2-6-3]
MADAALRQLDRDLPRNDMRSPALIAKQKMAARQTRPVRPRASETLHVAFSGPVADGLRRQAVARGESPQVLAAALLAKLLETDMANDLIGEGRAEFEAVGQGRRPFGEAGYLTLRQCAVIHLVGMHADDDGWCRMSMYALTALLRHETKMLVPNVLTAMEARGIMVRGRRIGRGAPTPWALTPVGKAIFEVLAGEAE